MIWYDMIWYDMIWYDMIYRQSYVLYMTIYKTILVWVFHIRVVTGGARGPEELAE